VDGLPGYGAGSGSRRRCQRRPVDGEPSASGRWREDRRLAQQRSLPTGPRSNR